MKLSNPIRIIGAVAVGVFLAGNVSAAPGSAWFGREQTADVVYSMQLPETVKVALLHSRRPVAIGCTGPYSYRELKKDNSFPVSSKSILKVKAGKHGLAIGFKNLGSLLLVAPDDSEGHLTLNGRPYRGKFILRARGKVIDVIEQISLEDYLNGVLPREVGADWPAESLKAQAVISRTFVVANIGKGNDKAYDVTNNVFSQVYGGLQDEKPASNQAVVDTRGEILTDDKGAALQTFFHSSCGGHTESPEYVWREVASAPDYLASVRDTYCKEDPFYNWQYRISAELMQKRLRRAGYHVGTIKSVKIAKKSPSGRAWQFAVDSSRGKMQIPGNNFRLALGPEALRSTLLTDIRKEGKYIQFEGHGWGHGVGMCQWGARGRALAGQSYEQILTTYYPKARLVKPAGSAAGVAPGDSSAR